MAEVPPSPATPAGGPQGNDGAPGTDGVPGTDGAPGKPEPRLGDLFWVGTACAISIIAGGGIGYAVDDAAGTFPWVTVAGLAFGVLSAVLLAVNQFRKYV
ncbi:MAG: AtpZ/AtpI family protein [Actinomycetota bacterium]|jgi:hypothetical protein|nr:AtpZ/AtpI family protein [Actinomycetota bacterium]